MRTRSRLLACAAVLVAAAACSHPPRFVKRTPVLRLLYVPRTVPCLDHPKFSFELHRRWKGPKEHEGGRLYLRPGADASLWISFVPKGSPGYKEPLALRQYMTTQGTTEDGHVLSAVEVSSRTASRVRFTTYRYDPEYMLGAKADISYTELTMMEDPDGVYLIRLHAPKDRFDRIYPDYEEFLKSLTLAAPRKIE